MRLINILKRNNVYYWTDKPFSVQQKDKIYQLVELDETYLNKFKSMFEFQNNCYIVISAAPKRVFINYNKAVDYKEKFYPDGEIHPLFLLH